MFATVLILACGANPEPPFVVSNKTAPAFTVQNKTNPPRCKCAAGACDCIPDFGGVGRCGCFPPLAASAGWSVAPEYPHPTHELQRRYAGGRWEQRWVPKGAGVPFAAPCPPSG